MMTQTQCWKRLAAWVNELVPERQIFARQMPVRLQVGLFVGLGIIYAGIGRFLPADGFIGFDWVNYFGHGAVSSFYTPWARYAAYVTWPGLIGLTFAAVSLAILKRAIHPLSALFAGLTLPLFWVIFLGQLEGLAVLGLLGLPWLIPLALLKPQVTVFACGARKSYLLAAIIFTAISVLIWGPWPLRALTSLEYYARENYVQDIALGIWGLPLALPLLWWSRGDMDMLMAGGAFMTLHLIPYNLLVIAPAIARIPPRAAAVACLLSWLPLSANWLGPIGWRLGWLFVAWLWLNLAAARYPQARFSVWLRRLG